MLGMNEILIMGLAVILLLFGAKKIPEFAKSLGRAKGEFERGKLEVEKEIRESKLKEQELNLENPIIKAAKNLGIDTTGKSEEELKKEIILKVTAS
jgi:sec-independent protein translocase protein TatA